MGTMSAQQQRKSRKIDESREIPARTAIEEKKSRVSRMNRESRRGGGDGRSRLRAVMSEKRGQQQRGNSPSILALVSSRDCAGHLVEK